MLHRSFGYAIKKKADGPSRLDSKEVESLRRSVLVDAPWDLISSELIWLMAGEYHNWPQPHC